MKTFENTTSNDTVLTGGLLAIAIAWIAFTALQGPVGAGTDRGGAALDAASVTTLRASATTHAMTQPADRHRAAGSKVS